MTITGIVLRATKGAALLWSELDGNFTRLKQAFEAFANRFEDGSRRTLVFSVTQPDDTGVIWARLSATTGVFVGLLYWNGTAWVEMFARSSWVGVDASTAANTILLTVDGLATLLAGQTVSWTNLLANTGAITVSINGGGPIPLLTPDGLAIASGAVPAAWASIAVYNGTELRLLNPSPPIVLTKKWVSDDVAIATATIPHTLGVVPSVVTMQLICQTAVDGYAVGDLIDVAIVYVSDGSDEDDYVYIHGTPSTANIVITVGADGDATVYKVKGGSGLRTAFVDANWKLRVTLFA